MIKLVATDLDGTLLRSDSSVSPRSRAALEAAEAAGLVVVFVTGRPPRWMDPIVEMTGHQGLALCGNGAIVVNLATGAVVSSHGLTAPAVLTITERLRECIPERLRGAGRAANSAPPVNRPRESCRPRGAVYCST